MVRVTDLATSIRFYELLGLKEVRRMENEGGRFTLVFLAAPDDADRSAAERAPEVELTFNWDPAPYAGGRNFGHLAYAVDDIYADCARLHAGGVTIARPPRDGPMVSRSNCCRKASRLFPPSPGRRCPTRASGNDGSRPRPRVHGQLYFPWPQRRDR
jgi:lactoylglutathione lyase